MIWKWINKFIFWQYSNKKRAYALMRGNNQSTIINVDNINMVDRRGDDTRIIFTGQTAIIEDPDFKYFNFLGRLLVDDYEPIKPGKEKEVKDDTDTL